MMKHNDFCLPDGMSAETFLADYWQKKTAFDQRRPASFGGHV